MPIWIGDRLIVACPADATYIRSDPRAIVLEADGVFGTGTHPTTQMCLLELQGRLQVRECVLDVGTGSGILAIAAARLGAARVVAVDKDLGACRVARANVRRNGFDHVVVVAAGTPAVLGQAAAFDVVVANLESSRDAGVWLQSISQVCRANGKVILSGIRAPDQGPSLMALRDTHLTRVARRTQENWVTLVLQKRP